MLLQFSEVCERAASGDLEARISNLPPGSDWERLGNSINHLLDIADAFVRESAAAMEHCSRDEFHRPIIRRGLQGAYEKAAVIINNGCDRMRENHDQILQVGRVASHTADNVNTVAAACEELSATGQSITKKAADTTGLTEAAVKETEETAHTVEGMSNATRHIEQIVAGIKRIADQTHLLALNASIEAARAGDHGHGFAVVANEVRNLSAHSAEYAGEINKEVASMRKTVKEVANRIVRVEASVRNIDQNARTISSAIAEQLQATTDIASSMGEISQNTTLVSNRIKR